MQFVEPAYDACPRHASPDQGASAKAAGNATTQADQHEGEHVGQFVPMRREQADCNRLGTPDKKAD